MKIAFISATKNKLVAKQRIGLLSQLRHTCDVIQNRLPTNDTMSDVSTLSKIDKCSRYTKKLVS